MAHLLITVHETFAAIAATFAVAAALALPMIGLARLFAFIHARMRGGLDPYQASQAWDTVQRLEDDDLEGREPSSYGAGA
jgi:hypothetical protein